MREVVPSRLSCNSPAMARVWPSRSSTTVWALRVFSPGTGVPPGTSTVPRVKSIELTSGSTDRRITSPSRMVGRKASRTPNSRNWMVIAPVPTPAPPPPWGTGIGNSPPARKVAE